MLTPTRQEHLASDVLRASFEASTLEDFSEQVLPLIEKLFETSASVLGRCNEKGEPIEVGGALEFNRIYREQYFLSDPMHSVIRRMNRKILHASTHAEWKQFLKLPLYLDHARHYGIDDYILLRLTEAIPYNLGVVGLLLARSRRQAEFREQDEHLMARLLPALEALVRRGARVEKLIQGQSVVERMADMDGQPKIALDVYGSLLWSSEGAERLMGLRFGGRSPVPEALALAARRLGALEGKEATFTPPPPFVTVAGPKGESVSLSLRLGRTRGGDLFVIAEAEGSDISPRLRESAARFHLTTSEARVLDLISQGLSDQKISRRLFVSLGTVRTHVGRILAKLGVRSRLQAALVAHGLKPETDGEEETLSK